MTDFIILCAVSSILFNFKDVILYLAPFQKNPQVAAGGHKKGITVKHACCAGPTWYVEADKDDMKDKLGNTINLLLVIFSEQK